VPLLPLLWRLIAPSPPVQSLGPEAVCFQPVHLCVREYRAGATFRLACHRLLVINSTLDSIRDFCAIYIVSLFISYASPLILFLLIFPQLSFPLRMEIYHQVCIAGESRRVVAPPCPWHLQRSPIGRVESSRSWSSHLFCGRPGGRRHVRSGARLSDTSMRS